MYCTTTVSTLMDKLSIRILASFPRNLAIPQLPRSSTWASLSLAMRGSLTVFPYRGLSPHQFTPMSGAHPAHSLDGGIAAWFHRSRYCPAASDARRFRSKLNTK